MHRNLAYLILIFYFFILAEVYKKKLKVFFNVIKIIGFLLIVQIVLGILTLLYGARNIFSIYAPN